MAWRLIIQNISGGCRISWHLAPSFKWGACQMLALQLGHVPSRLQCCALGGDTADVPGCDTPLIPHAKIHGCIPHAEMVQGHTVVYLTLFCWTIWFMILFLLLQFEVQLAFGKSEEMLAELFEWDTFTRDCFYSSHNAKHHCYHPLFYIQQKNGFFLNWTIR